MNKTIKELSVVELKAILFDLDQQGRNIQAQYTALANELKSRQEQAEEAVEVPAEVVETPAA